MICVSNKNLKLLIKLLKFLTYIISLENNKLSMLIN